MHLDWAAFLGSVVLFLSALAGAVVWLARLESKAESALKEIEHLKEVTIPNLESRIAYAEGHKSDVAVLSAQMEMVLERLKELSRDVRAMMDKYGGHS